MKQRPRTHRSKRVHQLREHAVTGFAILFTKNGRRSAVCHSECHHMNCQDMQFEGTRELQLLGRALPHVDKRVH